MLSCSASMGLADCRGAVMVTIFDHLAAWGRWTMVTIGFKELLEKLEEYFGKGVVKAFLALFALSALVWVAGLAVTQGVYPFGLWVGGLITGQPVAMTALQGIAAGLAGLWLGLTATVLWRLWRISRNTATLIKASSEMARLLEASEKADAKEL